MNVVRAAKHARWMNAPSCVNSKRVAITSLLAMAKSMASIKQVRSLLAVIEFLFLFHLFTADPLSAYETCVSRQATVSGKRLRTAAKIKTTNSTTMRTISTLCVVRVNTRKRSISAKENRQRSKRGSVRIATVIARCSTFSRRTKLVYHGRPLFLGKDYERLQK